MGGLKNGRGPGIGKVCHACGVMHVVCGVWCISHVVCDASRMLVSKVGHACLLVGHHACLLVGHQGVSCICCLCV